MARYGYQYAQDTNSRIAYADDWSTESIRRSATRWYCLACNGEFIANDPERCPMCDAEEVLSA